MLAEHIEYLTFAEFAREANLSESEIRLLVIQERIAPSLWLESFSLKPTARAGLYYLLSPRQTGAHNCCFLNTSKARFARGEVSVSDREPNPNFYDVMPITLDMVVAHGVLMRDELRRIAPAAMTSEPAVPLMAGEHLTAGLENEAQSGRPEKPPDTAPSPDRDRRVKRAALIADNVRRWPKVERHLRDAAANGLSQAARASEHGWWWEKSALEWARARGYLDVGDAESTLLASTMHRMSS